MEIEIYFKTEEYRKILSDLFGFEIKRINNIPDEYLDTYKEYLSDVIELDDETEWQMIERSHFYYEIDDEYFGIFRRKNGYEYIVKCRDECELFFVGDSLFNWLCTEKPSLMKRRQLEWNNFKKICENKYNIDTSKSWKGISE